MRLFLYQAGYSILLLCAPVLGLFSKKIRQGFWRRWGLLSRLSLCAHKDGGYLWFHVASSGELEQCVAVLDVIKRRRPGQRIFLSYFSPSAERAITLEKKRRDLSDLPLPWDYADYSPFDLFPCVNKALDVLKPTAFITIHRELWPVTIQACKRRGIGCFLFGTYFPSVARKRMGFYQSSLSVLNGIGSVDSASADFFKSLFPHIPVENLGDPRIDRVLSRKSLSRRPAWESFFSHQTVALFASVWPKDLQALEPALGILREKYPQVRILCAPHEPDEPILGEIKRLLRREDHRPRLWSHWFTQPDEFSPLIIDRVGILAELYRIASFVFVGGSFQSRVHNVLEPAAYAKPILTGPCIANSAEALEMQAYGLIKTATPEELKRNVIELMENPALRHTLGEKSLWYLTQRAGASERYFACLQDWAQLQSPTEAV